MSNVVSLQIPTATKTKKSRGYDYANLKKFTKSQIGGLTKHLAGLRFNRLSETATNSNHDLWTLIFNRAEELGLEIGYSEAYGERLDFIKPRKITAEQTAFGKAWLKDYFFKLNGQPRGGKRMECVGPNTLRIAKSVVRFEFVGVQVLASSGWYPCQVLPIYRAFNRKGEYFDYAPIHWGEPLIMERS
jgi:hypothetical protein